jgi:hypothetical protein
MTRIESYGDSLKKGDYQCHSRFKRAVNFMHGPVMAALVDREIGPGPNHIIMAGIDGQKVERMTIGAAGLVLDGRPFAFAPSRCYDSRIGLEADIDRRRFKANLEFLARDLRRSAPARSLAFLLEPRPATRRSSVLEKTIAARLVAAREMVFSGNFFEGIGMFKGLGFGLTPGGDDFIGGVLLALHGGQKIFARDFASAIGSVRRLAKGGNPFSNAMFAHAASGRAAVRIKDLLAALVYGGEKKVARCAGRLRAIGHSSGIDFGTGLLLTCRELCRREGEKWW